MNLGRIFANAVVRRFAYVLVAVVLSWAGLGGAKAQGSPPPACGIGDNCTREVAIQRCQAMGAYTVGFAPGTSNPTCTLFGANRYICRVSRPNGAADQVCDAMSGVGWGREFYFTSDCPAGKIWNEAYGACQAPCTTSARPSSTVPRSPLSGSVGCNTGCQVTYRNNGDDTSTVSVNGAMCGPDFKNNCPTGSFWNGMMALCQPLDPTCPAGQVKKEGVCAPDSKCPQGMVAVQGTTPGAVQQGELFCKAEASECPAGTIKAPATGKCIPGEGQCAAGEARRDNGTCGKDSDGDGKADEDDDNPDNDPKKDTASGGDSCDAPPACSGNAISCIQVKIQWRIDCNTRRAANISGGSCNAVPVCTGKNCDAMEYASLMQQWKAACSLEKIAKKDGDKDDDGTDGNGNGVPDALEGTGDVADAGDGKADVDGAKRFGIGVSTSLLSQDNIFGSGSCPQPPTFKYMGTTVSGSDFPYWCQAMAILRGLILIFGAFTALKILMGWGF